MKYYNLGTGREEPSVREVLPEPLLLLPQQRGLYLFSEALTFVSYWCLTMSEGRFVRILQMAWLWFVENLSCQRMGTALCDLPIQTLVLPSYGWSSGSTCSWGAGAKTSTTRHLFLTCTAAVSHSFWHFPFRHCWQLFCPSTYGRKALRGVPCFAQRMFISRKLLVSMLEDCRGEGEYAYCSYSCSPLFCMLAQR